jgi:hypothetical protein
VALQLTASEAETVAQKSKNEDELPVYYNSDLQTNVKISRDFEAFLILSPDDLKTAAVAWIKQSVALQQTNKDRDALLSLAISQEMTNAQSKMNALDQVLGNFNKFRLTFQTSSTFTNVPEVQRFLLDLQRPIEELVVARDRAQFDNVASQVIQRKYDQLVVSAPEIQELQSWQSVLSAYLQG